MEPKTLQLNWTKSFNLYTSSVDSTGNATPSILCDFLQEVASSHAEHLGWGFDNLKDNNWFWVLSRLRLKVNHFPHWKDQVEVETWPSGKNGLLWTREFEIRDLEKQLIGQATSGWLVIDLNSKRPQRVDPAALGVDIRAPRKVFEEPLDKVQSIPEGESVYQRKIGYLDIDVQQHLNNVKFVDWVLEGFTMEFHKVHQLQELEINFLAEAFYGQTIHHRQHQLSDDTFSHSLYREDDGKEICRAKTIWQPRS